MFTVKEEGGSNILDVVLSSVLAPFLNRHSHVLQSFKLWWTLTALDLDTFFLPITTMDKLEHVSIDQTFLGTDLQTTSFSGLHHFFAAQSSFLNILDLDFQGFDGCLPRDEDWFDRPCFKVPFPRLESLAIRACGVSGLDLPSAVPYVNRYIDTLTSLTIKSEELHLAHGDFINLVDLFGEVGKLRRLSCTILYLDPTLLDHTSKSLPKLEALTLTIRDFLDKQSSLQLSTDFQLLHEQFCKEMRSYGHLDWGLRELNIHLGAHNGLSATHLLKNSCYVAIIEAIPTSEKFNSVSRKNILAKFTSRQP